MNGKSPDPGPALFSYGFRPFFLSAALFAGITPPLWILVVTGTADIPFLHAPREWHVHEMTFGFLSGVMTGFLLTAIPNWTDRPPLTGRPLLLLWLVWVAGRLAMTMTGISQPASAIIDGAFLVIVAGMVWREIIAGKVWDRLPIGVIISLYAGANLLFHAQAINGVSTGAAERMALALIMLLLAMIGGRLTPGFTEDEFKQQSIAYAPAPFSRFDGLSLLLAAVAGLVWIIQPQGLLTGLVWLITGMVHLARMSRWFGWLTWREPLVCILHVGYAWLAMAMVSLGGSALGYGLYPEDAIHAVTTGAVGAMTLAVMTRASLGHTGRPKQAGRLTVMVYLLVNTGAALRVFGPGVHLPGSLILGMAALCWSGAYLLFVVGYGPMLLRPALDES